MAKKLNVNEIDALIEGMQKELDELAEDIVTKTNDYDIKAKEAREKFIAAKIVPMQEKVAGLKTEIAKYNQIKKILN